MASRPFDFSNRSSNYKSYQFGPRSAFRTPPPIPCPMPLMNSLWPATFWVSGRQTFFASSFLHAEKTTAKSADGHVWVLGGCLPFPIQLLANSPQKPPPAARGDLFQDPTACCCLDKDTSERRFSYLIFPLQVLITNPMFSDLGRPCVHSPPLAAGGHV